MGRGRKKGPRAQGVRARGARAQGAHAHGAAGDAAAGDAAAALETGSGSGPRGRRRRGGPDGAGDATAPERGPREGEWETDTGTVRLERDRYAANAWTLFVNGVPSSHVDLDDPSALDFEYMRWMAAVISARFAPGVALARDAAPGAAGGAGVADVTGGAASGVERPAPSSPDPLPRREPASGGPPFLRALHLGGGACSMARWVHATYPDARQVVVELDARLTTLVRDWFSLPSAPLLRLRPGDAGAVLPTLNEATRDVIVRDVFAGDSTPAALTTREFHAQAARVLAPGGLYLLNVGDGPDLAGLRSEAAALRSVFAHVAAVADPAMLKGRRRGNVVLAASDASLPLGPALTRTLLADPLPASVWDEERLSAFLR